MEAIKVRKNDRMRRTTGYFGAWEHMPNIVAIRERLNTDPALRCVERATIERLIYPKTTELIYKTCTFVVDTILYRSSEDMEKDKETVGLHPFGTAWAGHVQARIGGLDFYHLYNLYVSKEKKVKYNGQNTNIVVHAEAIPKRLDAYMLQSMLLGLGAAVKDNVEFAVLEKRAQQFLLDGEGRGAVDSFNSAGGLWSLLVSRVPYFRMIRSPLMFRLWPQKQLLKLNYSDFCKIATHLESGSLKPLCFTFAWLNPCADLDELDLAHMTTAHQALNYEQLDELIVCEFFQSTLHASRQAGHTYSTLQHLVNYYTSARSYGLTPRFSLNTLFRQPANRTYLPKQLLDSMTAYLPLAISHKIVKLVYHPECPKAIYAMDDYIKQNYVVDFINKIGTDRWDPAIHCDGCKTASDVFAKIAAKQPSPNADKPGVPQWDNKEFQTLFATLDMEQRQTVANCVLHFVSMASGPPGSGKTTTGQAIYYLFGGGEAVLPLAPYGRIASLWRDLLDDRGYTYHRATSMAKYQRNSPEAQGFKFSNEWELDEYGLITHHHLYMALSTFGHSTLRLVFFGDPHQKGAIGSGSIGKSLYMAFKDDPNVSTLLALPHRFALPGTLPDSYRDFVWQRPVVSDSMCIAWNMRQILQYSPDDQEDGTGKGRDTLDLVYSTDVNDIEAKFILAPRLYSRTEGTKDMDGLKNTLRPILESLLGPDVLGKGEVCFQKIHAMGIQFLTQRNNDRKAMNEAVFQLAFGARNDRSMKSFYPSERVTFSTNKYFAKDNKGKVIEAGTDRSLEHVNLIEMEQNAGIADPVLNTPIGHMLRTAGYDRVLGLADERLNEHAKSRKRRREEDPDDFRKGESDDVFNGEIRQIKRIVDIDGKNHNITDIIEHTNERNNNRSGKRGVAKKRILEFNTIKNERRLLNITDDYDTDEMDRAYCLTAAKMQGSEDKIVIYVVTPAPSGHFGMVASTLVNEELYMATTRGKKRLIVVAGRDEREGLVELRAIARVHEERPRNVFGKLLKLYPEKKATNPLLLPMATTTESDSLLIPSEETTSDKMVIDDNDEIDFDD